MVRRQNSRSLLGCRDLAAVRQHRGDHNRLGFAVRFCYPRYPGRVLAENETPPAALLDVVAAQLQVQPALWDGYAQRDFFRHHLLPTTREEDRQDCTRSTSPSSVDPSSMKPPPTIPPNPDA